MEQNVNEQKPRSANQPAHTIRLGLIKCVIWRNTVGNGGVVYNVNLVRLYIDDARKWHETNSLGRDDLLLAAKVLDLAHSWIHERPVENADAE